MSENSFGQDVEFLNRFVETIVLTNGQSQIAVVPAYQGRTMTSTSRGRDGNSYGFVNHDHIASGKHDPQINVYGGEDRFWISPEGGQFSVFFVPGGLLEYRNWRAPQVLDTETFEIVAQSKESISFTKQAALTNYSRFEFHLQMDRMVSILGTTQAAERLGIPTDDLDIVFHESQNKITNIGESEWQPETGLISVWILSMHKPSPQATLLVPFKKGSSKQLGNIVNADYFGKLDQSRLVVDEDSGLIFFLGDGQMRSKLGLTFQRVMPRLGSWDKERGVLSVVEFNLPPAVANGYTNNLWKHQEHPFGGDVINCYNDGPNESGGQLGGFFELETISPALALAPGENFTHVHSTIHMEGKRSALSHVAEKVFGVGLDQIESQFCSDS